MRCLLRGCSATFICLGVAACSPSAVQHQQTLQTALISDFQTELLQIAFNAASAMPLKPHIKDRSRTQERVVNACFELEQPKTALKYIDQIANWRRGLGFADYAFYSAERGVTNGIELLLEKAESIGRTASQEWRTDKVLDRIHQVRSLMSHMALPKSDVRAEDSNAVFETEFNTIDKEFSSGEFDAIQAAMNSCCSLYETYYDRDELRARVEEKIDAIRGRLPVFIRLQYMNRMVHVALDHKDKQEAHRLLSETGRFISANTWPAQYHVKALADFASLQAECGDGDAAVTSLNEARNLYIQNVSSIINIDRADTLLPIAEAALVLNKPELAMDVYGQALRVLMENPNSRPRADDLVLICVSMALHAVEPNDALWQQIHEIKDGLGEPW